MTKTTEVYSGFGGLTALFEGCLPELRAQDFLQEFRIPKTEPDLWVHVSMTPELALPPEEQCIYSAYAFRVYRQAEQCRIYYQTPENGGFWTYSGLQYDLRTPDRMELKLLDHRCAFQMSGILSCITAESLFLRHDRAILHASCIERNGEAILFSAPSGTGKSTQAALWEKYRGAEIVNGDKILLWNPNGRELACGLPYAGTSGICKNRIFPIRAVIMLRQGKENRMIRCKPSEGARMLLRQMPVQAWSHADIASAMRIAGRVAENVPIYSYACVPEECAVDFLEQELKRGEENGET